MMWRHNTIARIIENPAYIGRATYGLRRRVKSANGGHRTTLNDPEKVAYVEVPAIVSPELAQAAREALTRNQRMATRNTKDS